MFCLVLLVTIFSSSYVHCVRVCDNCKYYVKPNKEHCHDNPDGEKNMTQILKNWPDVKVEEYNVYTEDGYQILIVRAYNKIEKDPIVLGHSILITPLGFVNRGKKSLAHFLITKGHDVWIVNFRSSAYSRKHKNLTVEDDAYWNFSFHEVGIYDLDTAFNLVKKKTNKKAIYIAHSAGTTLGYVYGSLKPDAAKSNLKGIVSLAPVAYLDGVKSYLKYIIPLSEYLRPIIYQRTHGEVRLDWRLLNCSSLLDLYLDEIIETPLYGDDFGQIDDEYLPIKRLQNNAKSVGVDVFVHLSQIQRSKEFQERDFGRDTNLQKYGQETPPPYPISSISVPQAFLVGHNDWVSPKENCLRFYNKLNPKQQCGFQIIECDKWNHKDFITAKNVKELLYGQMYEVVEKMSSETCSA